MRLAFVVILVLWTSADCQLWKLPQEFLNSLPWFRQAKAGEGPKTPHASLLPTTEIPTTGSKRTLTPSTTKRVSIAAATSTRRTTIRPNSTKRTTVTSKPSPSQKYSSVMPTATKRVSNTSASYISVSSQKVSTASTKLPTTMTTTAKRDNKQPNATSSNPPTTGTKKATSTSWMTVSTLSPKNFTQTATTSTSTTDSSTLFETTTSEVAGTTAESRDNHRVHHFYMSKHEKPQVKIVSNISQNLLPLPADASAALVKPTKYHYYPHNQHIYLLPECAIQQVCNAVYVRLNWTQPLCACPSRYRDPCSASLNSDDQHTTELLTNYNQRKALTLVKTCEPTSEMRMCRAPRDWSLLALQNIRTGKSHYLVICRCPDTSILEGPMSHNQPTYASVPGIRVYGMMCVQTARRDRSTKEDSENPDFPWQQVEEFAKTAHWD